MTEPLLPSPVLASCEEEEITVPRRRAWLDEAATVVRTRVPSAAAQRERETASDDKEGLLIVPVFVEDEVLVMAPVFVEDELEAQDDDEQALTRRLVLRRSPVLDRPQQSIPLTSRSG